MRVVLPAIEVVRGSTCLKNAFKAQFLLTARIRRWQELQLLADTLRRLRLRNHLRDERE